MPDGTSSAVYPRPGAATKYKEYGAEVALAEVMQVTKGCSAESIIWTSSRPAIPVKYWDYDFDLPRLYVSNATATEVALDGKYMAKQ